MSSMETPLVVACRGLGCAGTCGCAKGTSAGSRTTSVSANKLESFTSEEALADLWSSAVSSLSSESWIVTTSTQAALEALVAKGFGVSQMQHWPWRTKHLSTSFPELEVLYKVPFVVPSLNEKGAISHTAPAQEYASMSDSTSWVYK